MMFNPSKNLLFRPVPTLNKLRIHQPLPLNPRESTQLLNLLTSSFRKQLDTEHGRFKPEGEQKVAAKSTQHHGTTKARRRSFSEPWHPIDRHMNSLFTNPLFSHSEDKKLSRTASLDPIDPFVLFDSAVARGMMNRKYARVLLEAKKRDIIDSPAPSIREGMRQSGAGFKVLKWLIASGATNDLEFLKDEAFLSVLMQYMVAEGLQEVAWTWIKKSFRGLCELTPLRAGEKWDSAHRNVAMPLLQLVKAEAEGPNSLDDAFMCLSRATGYLQGSPGAETNIALGPAGRWLAHQVIHPSSRRTQPTESTFESFISLIPAFTREVSLHYAHLNLIHPTKPTSEFALKFFNEFEESSQERAEKSLRLSPATERKYVYLGLETARFLIEKHQYNEADAIMDLLQTNFPRQLGERQVKKIERVKAEASTLDLLEGLSLA